MRVIIKELIIESDEDFSHVSIDFSKGTVVSSDAKSPDIKTNIETPEKKTPNYKQQEVALDLDEEFLVSEEIVEKPNIDLADRPVKVAKGMNEVTF